MSDSTDINQRHRNNALWRGATSGAMMMGYLAYLNGGNFAATFTSANAMEAGKIAAASAAADLFTVQVIGRMDLVPQKAFPIVQISPLGLLESAVAGSIYAGAYMAMYPAAGFNAVRMLAIPAGIDLGAQVLQPMVLSIMNPGNV
jgi:hypothetical protein